MSSSLESFDAAVLGERLRIARAAAKKTQEAAATEIGVARTTLVAIERGERRVRAHELMALARAYGTTVNALLRPTSIHIETRAAHFRANDANDAAREEAIALLLKLAGSYVELERAVGRPLRPVVSIPEYPLGRGSMLSQAEDAATQVRSLLGIGTNPIPDLLALAELQMGLRVFVRPLDPKIAGAYVHHPELGGCVLINAKHPQGRRAWTLGHETGHYVGSRETPHVVTTNDRPNDDAFADAFAGALLMPPAALRRRFAEIASTGARFSPRDLILLAHEYRVSVEAMCRWLERLELLRRQTYDALRDRGLNATLERSVVGDPAPDLRTPVPARLALIAAEAHERGLVSEGQLGEMLGLDRLTVRELLDSMPEGDFDERA